VGQRKLRSPDGRGKRGETTWDYWFAREPNRFHNGVGPQQTSTFYQHWKTDIQLLKQLNHNSFRTSISWARLIPDGIGEVNPKRSILSSGH
jgi:6-phospho-beta-glucosidase